MKVSGYYVFPFGLQAGVNAAFATGAPLSILGYSNSGYAMYLAPRGSWDQLPSTYQVDLHVEYPFRLGSVTITPLVDVFNLTDAQPATARGRALQQRARRKPGPALHAPDGGELRKGHGLAEAARRKARGAGHVLGGFGRARPRAAHGFHSGTTAHPGNGPASRR